MKLTTNERLVAMKKLFTSKGLTTTEASKLYRHAVEGDEVAIRRWNQMVDEFQAITSNSVNRKLANRNNTEAKGILKNLESAESMFQVYKAQAKNPSLIKENGEIHRLFNKSGLLTVAEQIVLLSNSKQSVMFPVNLWEAEHLRLADDLSLRPVASNFCRRFNLKV